MGGGSISCSERSITRVIDFRRMLFITWSAMSSGSFFSFVHISCIFSLWPRNMMFPPICISPIVFLSVL